MSTDVIMLTMKTKEDKNAWQRKHRQENNNLWTKKYEKTRKGFLMRTYRNMQSRVTGVQWKKAHLYNGLALLPRQTFYDWALSDRMFDELFIKWEQSNYDRKLTPSINRINSHKGYLEGNIEWLTHSENSRLGAISEKRKVYAP